MLKRFLILIPFMGLQGLALAQTELDPVTVTASLSEQQASKTGRSIIILNAEQINKLPVRSVDELLRYLPGVEIKQSGPTGSQSHILIRGGSFQQVLVILDGIRVNDPLTGHFNSQIPLSMSEIERVEVLKGASSAVYGSEAVGGVVNIITKTFAAKQGQEQMQASANVSAGEYGLLNMDIGAFRQHKNTALSLGLLSNHTDGAEQRGTRGFVHNNTLSAALKQQFNDQWSIALRSAYDRRSFSAQNFYSNFLSDTASADSESWWNQLKLTYRQEHHSFSIDAGYKLSSSGYAFAPTVSPNLHKSRLFQTLATYDYKPNEQRTITAGLQILDKQLRSNDRGNHAAAQTGVFLLWKEEWNRFTFSPALRLDQYNDQKPELIPQLNVSYRATDQWTLRGSAGKATREADFTERYNNSNKTSVVGGSIGNPDLQAERAGSYEVGTDYRINDYWKVSAGAFKKTYTRLIDWVNTPYEAMPQQHNLLPGTVYALASNISSLEVNGLEMDLRMNRDFDNHQSLFATAGILWMNSWDPNGTPSLYTSSAAKFLFNFNTVYRYRTIQLAIDGLYKQRATQSGDAALTQLSKDYFLLNARLEADVYKQNTSLFLQADNVFNRHYADLFGVPMPGRWWMLGIKWRMMN